MRGYKGGKTGAGILRVLVPAIFVTAVLLASPAAAFSKAPADSVSPAKGGVIFEGMPWVIKSEGEPVACVRSRKEAESVLFGLRLRYAKTVSAQLTAEVKEDITIERAEPKAYKRWEVMSVTDAVKSIARRCGADDPASDPAPDPVITVVTKKAVKDEKPIKQPVKVIRRKDLPAGEIKVKEKGKSGAEETVSEVTLENGSVRDVEEIESRTAALPEQAVVYEGIAPGAAERGEMVIDCAVRFLGTRYVWGGNDLREGIDCSGFTKAIYAMFGVDLPRHSSAQAEYGTEVAYEEARAGDIICYDGHVALYIGGGRIIHATPGQVQFGEDAAYRKILTVRRIFPEADKSLYEDDTDPETVEDPEAIIKETAPNDNEAAQAAAKERDDARAARRRAVEKKAEAMIEKELDQ